MSHPLSRRQFLKIGGATTGFALVGGSPALALLEPLPEITNPLQHYPSRDWEHVYRDQYRYDSTFTFVCSPNDTHQCRIKCFVRNGILIRTEQPYNMQQARDIYGNTTTAAYNPRMCLKGMTIARRVYGPYRIKYPMARKSVYEAYKEGKLTWRVDNRGLDDWVRVPWDEAFDLVAKKIIEVSEKHGPWTVKLSPVIELCGAVAKHGSLNRFANMLGLFGRKFQVWDPEEERWEEEVTGGTVWSEYDWYGDLDPGHPVVTGVQTFDPELPDQRRAKLIVHVGKNMVENKMPAAHWFIEAIERGAKLVGITPDYNPFSTKCDYWIPVRPGSDTALFLGIANHIIQNDLYDADFLVRFTDAPLLVRLDTLKRLRADEVFANYQNKPLTGKVQKVSSKLRERWGDFVVWDQRTDGPKALSREDVGQKLDADPALLGTFDVTLIGGKRVKVVPQFQMMKETYAEYTLDVVTEITQAPRDLIERLAHDLATIKPACIHSGEGVNHYYHNDLKARAFFLVQSLTGNLGKPGANVGTWAGNYKIALLNGIKTFYAEDPNSPALDPNTPGDQVPVRRFLRDENPVYFAYGGNTEGRHTQFTGKTHLTPPTKIRWHANQNFTNNAKWAFQITQHWDRDVELVVNNDWEWTDSCEYADVVFPVHSWPELTLPEIEGSCSEPFVEVWKGGLAPLFDTKCDSEVAAGVAKRMGEHLIERGDREVGQKMIAYWKFILEGDTLPYIQRVLDAGSNTRGYNAREMLESEHAWLWMTRTTPRIPGYEQIHDSVPFYTKTGRIENYKDESVFLAEGENLVIHREPIESTPYLPNVIVSSSPYVRPEDRKVPLDAEDVELKQARAVKMDWRRVKGTKNPLWERGYRFVVSTPKSRHRVHSSWGATDWNVIWSTNFGDPYRADRRSPGAGEHQIEINPDDGKALGIKDGDYVTVEADPVDRPFIGWQDADPLTQRVTRLMVRCKFNPRMRPGFVTINHAAFSASHKSVIAHETRPDGLAVTPEGYQAAFRYGSHQSLTRVFLKPTQMTDGMARKDNVGHHISVGYEGPVHSPSTCPKEALVRIAKAEDGGRDGRGPWEPTRSGFTPGNENEFMRRYLAGELIKIV